MTRIRTHDLLGRSPVHMHCANKKLDQFATYTIKSSGSYIFWSHHRKIVFGYLETTKMQMQKYLRTPEVRSPDLLHDRPVLKPLSQLIFEWIGI